MFCSSYSRCGGLVIIIMQCVIVVFPDHTHFLPTFFILIHILIKIQQKSGIGVIRGGGGYYAIPRT